MKGKLESRVSWPVKRPLSVAIPQCREPFVNAQLLRLTPGDDGLDRYWISSWNSVDGSLGVLANELGEERLYRFRSAGLPGFYSVVQSDQNTLWLCGDLSFVVRLDLVSGRYEKFETGAPGALVFAGMAYDEPTGRLFAIAYPPPRTMGFVFDIGTCKGVKVFELQTDNHYMRSSYAHGDGTYSIELQSVGMTMVRWHAASGEIEMFPVVEKVNMRTTGQQLYQLVSGDDGRLYMPELGWYDPATGKIDRRWRHKNDKITWFTRDADMAYGFELGTGKLHSWHFKSNEVKLIADCNSLGLDYMNSALTASGRLVGVSLAGVFSRINLANGDLEISKELPTIGTQVTDCVVRIDKERILGTPFITQRFWEANLRTGKGFDCGLAAPGNGEILRVWNVGGKVYMAAYAGGELMEYDPARHPHFPENPRVVAKPPTGMRPVGAADDGRRIFYCCSSLYGSLGSVVVSYDTKTGLARYHDNPLPDHQIQELFYDKKSNSLLCGTTIHADCKSAPAVAERSLIARLDADTLEVLEQCEGPEGSDKTAIYGPLGGNRWLAVAWGNFDSGGYGPRWFVFDANTFTAPAVASLQYLAEGWWGRQGYAGRVGHFLVLRGERVEVWDMRKPKCLQLLAEGPGLHTSIQGRDVLLWESHRVYVLEGVL